MVEALDARGDPEQVLYEFPVPLEDPSLRLDEMARWRVRSLDSTGHRSHPDVLPRARNLLSDTMAWRFAAVSAWFSCRGRFHSSLNRLESAAAPLPCA